VASLIKTKSNPGGDRCKIALQGNSSRTEEQKASARGGKVQRGNLPKVDNHNLNLCLVTEGISDFERNPDSWGGKGTGGEKTS